MSIEPLSPAVRHYLRAYDLTGRGSWGRACHAPGTCWYAPVDGRLRLWITFSLGGLALAAERKP